MHFSRGENVAIAAKPDLFSSRWVQEGAGGCPHYKLRARDLLPGCSAAGIWGRKCEDNEGADIKTSNREIHTYAAHRQSGKKQKHREWRGEREGSRNGRNMGRKRGKRAQERRTWLTLKERRQRECQNIVISPSTGIVPYNRDFKKNILYNFMAPSLTAKIWSTS